MAQELPAASSASAARRERDQVDSEDADLRHSLATLSSLAMGRGHRALPDMLTDIAHLAVQAIPQADGAGVTLVEEGRPDTIVSTKEFVRQVDEIQYGLGEGPCISAALHGQIVRSGSLGDDPAWPHFGRLSAQLGVHSVLSLPILGSETVLGAMNVYAHVRNAFNDRAAELGERFAVPAAFSVQSAQALFQARRLADELQVALSSRVVVERAVGVVMSRSGCSAEEAFRKLRVLSQTQNRKVSLVAQQLIDEAVHRVRARRTD